MDTPRLWLTFILGNTQIAEDYAEDMQTRYNDLLLKQNRAILDNKMEDAKFLAHEAEVYNNMGKTVRKELREIIAQSQLRVA